MSSTAIVRSCATLNEAYICWGLLQTHGVEASIDNADHAAVDWFAVQALGGVYVRVPASQLKAAQNAIIAHVADADAVLNEHAGSYEPITTSQRWKAVTMLLIWFGVLHVALWLLVWMLDSLIPREWINHWDVCLTLKVDDPRLIEKVPELESWDAWLDLFQDCYKPHASPYLSGYFYPYILEGLIYAAAIALLISLKIATARRPYARKQDKHA